MPHCVVTAARIVQVFHCVRSGNNLEKLLSYILHICCCLFAGSEMRGVNLNVEMENISVLTLILKAIITISFYH